MTQRSQFDEIRDSIINGQRRQAFNQMLELGEADMPELLDYLANDLSDPDLAIDAAKTYFRNKSR